MYDDRNDARKVDISLRLGGWGAIPPDEPYHDFMTVDLEARRAVAALDTSGAEAAHATFRKLCDAQWTIAYGHFHSYQRHDFPVSRIHAALDAVQAKHPFPETADYCQRVKIALRRRRKASAVVV